MSTQNIEKEAAGQLLDSLYLDMFHLIEDHTQSRINIERTNASGAILLARTRFQQGGNNSVSTAQIPTENSTEFNALCRVVSASDEKNGNEIIIERHAVEKSTGYVEPLNWFSVLPPMSLRQAASKFKDCIELLAESANLQRQLDAVINNISSVKQFITKQ
ncbi:coiled-coil domain-containing protein 115 [Drosophila tropicalis]|uniref:coiled-coil domain-containing protein 115 n=1 Tax=Drosophila tropicalis TaxID=46794 RepID=UPI0035ABE5BA